MPTRFFIFLIFIFIGSVLQCNAQDTDQNTVSIELENSIQIRDIILEGNKLLAKQKYNDAIKKYALADSLAAEIENDRLQASSKHNIGLCYFRLGEYIESREYFEEAINLSELIRDELKMASYKMSMGVLYKKQDMFVFSMKYITESLKIAEKYNNKELMATGYNSIAGIQKTLGNYRNAFEYYIKVEKVFMDENNLSGLASVYNNIGYVFKKIDSLKVSHEYYLKSIKIKKKTGDKGSLISTYKNVGDVWLLMNKIDSAQTYFQLALELSKETKHRSKVVMSLSALAKLNIQKEDYKLAKYYLEQVELINKNVISKTLLLEYYKLSMDLYKATNDYKEAQYFSELYNLTSNELLDKEKAKGLDELRFQYETEKKNQTIFTLNHINKLKNKSIIFISIALLIILILSSVLFKAYYQKKKAHQLIQLLSQESRHRTKNNLQLLSSILSLHSDQVSEDHRDEVMAAEYRVESIVLLNKQLDIDDHKGRVSLDNYLSDLCNGLLEAYTADKSIQLELNFDDVNVLPHQATHLGLIINELITNSIKYAFHKNENPIIKLECLLFKNNQCKISLEDNGIGLPLNWEEKTESSLGLNLVRDLGEQLKGEFIIENRKGFFFQMIFQIQ